MKWGQRSMQNLVTQGLMGHDTQLDLESKDSRKSLLDLPLWLLKFALVSLVASLSASSKSECCNVYTVPRTDCISSGLEPSILCCHCFLQFHLSLPWL